MTDDPTQHDDSEDSDDSIELPSKREAVKRPDPKLNSFLRQAAAIIAAERGLNPQSRLKLQSLADHLQIPAESFKQAMAQLQEEDKKPKAVDRYEVAFLGFLEREYKKLPDAILSISKQNRAIDRAHKKFQISEVRAQQLIARQAAAMGVSCISRSEAKRFIVQSIADRIGNERAIDDQSHEQFYKLGQRWGVNKEEMDELILAQLGKNRDVAKARKKSKTLKPILIALTLLVLGAGGWLAWKKFNPTTEISNPGTQPKDVETLDPIEIKTLKAAWWSPELTTELHELAGKDPQFGAVLESIASDSAKDRKLGLSRATETLLSGSAANESSLRAALGELLLVEEGPGVVSETVEQVLSTLKFPAQHPASIRQVLAAFRANQFLVSFSYSKAVDTRTANLRTQVRRTVFNATGVDPEENEENQLLAQTERVLSIDAWNHLQATLWGSSNRASALVEPLYELTKRKLERAEVNQFRSQALIAIIGADSSQWRDLKSPIQDAVQAADEIKVNEWIKVYESFENRGFREFLGPLLASQSGVDVKNSSPTEIRNALRSIRTDYRMKILKPLMDRNELASDRMKRALKVDSARLPERIAQIAYASDVGIAFSRDLRIRSARSSNDFGWYEKTTKQPLTNLETTIQLSNGARTIQSAAPRPTASDNRNKAEILQRLADMQTTSSFARITAVERLSEIAKRFEDVSYSEAVSLARYILSDELTQEEALNIEKNLNRFAHWPSLLLAVCDVLPNSKVSLDSMLMISRELIGVQTQVSNSKNWRNEVRDQIFSGLMRKIENRLQTNPKSERNDWLRLEKYMAEVLQRRIELLGGSLNKKQQAAGDVVQLGRVLVATGIKYYNPKNRLRFERAIEINGQMQTQSLAQMIAMEQLLIQVIRHSQNERTLELTSQIQTALSEQELRMASCETLGQQLELTELTLAKIWALEREALVESQWKRK